MEESRFRNKMDRISKGAAEDEDLSASDGKQYSKVLGKYYVPRKRYMGPISLDEQGLPPLRVFRGRVRSCA